MKDTHKVNRIAREYKVGLLFFLLGCCAYAAIHLHHFRSQTEHRIEVASFGLIGFGAGQLSFGWAVRRRLRQKDSAEPAARPNGGPAESAGNQDVGSGPPSVG